LQGRPLVPPGHDTQEIGLPREVDDPAIMQLVDEPTVRRRVAAFAELVRDRDLRRHAGDDALHEADAGEDGERSLRGVGSEIRSVEKDTEERRVLLDGHGQVAAARLGRRQTEFFVRLDVLRRREVRADDVHRPIVRLDDHLLDELHHGIGPPEGQARCRRNVLHERIAGSHVVDDGPLEQSGVPFGGLEDHQHHRDLEQTRRTEGLRFLNAEGRRAVQVAHVDRRMRQVTEVRRACHGVREGVAKLPEVKARRRGRHVALEQGPHESIPAEAGRAARGLRGRRGRGRPAQPPSSGEADHEAKATQRDEGGGAKCLIRHAISSLVTTAHSAARLCLNPTHPCEPRRVRPRRSKQRA
jgi:hypothetical protein